MNKCWFAHIKWEIEREVFKTCRSKYKKKKQPNKSCISRCNYQWECYFELDAQIRNWFQPKKCMLKRINLEFVKKKNQNDSNEFVSIDCYYNVLKYFSWKSLDAYDFNKYRDLEINLIETRCKNKKQNPNFYEHGENTTIAQGNE